MGQGIDPDLRALPDVRDCVARASAAVEAVHGWDQRRVDEACAAMAKAGAAAAYDLARLAVEETGIGRVHYKVLKNLFGSEGVWNSIKDEKTVGIVKRDERSGIVEVASPVGVIAGIVPTTNPTSTTLFKSLIAVKGRNAIVISPHPRSRLFLPDPRLPLSHPSHGLLVKSCLHLRLLPDLFPPVLHPSLCPLLPRQLRHPVLCQHHLCQHDA